MASEDPCENGCTSEPISGTGFIFWGQLENCSRYPGYQNGTSNYHEIFPTTFPKWSKSVFFGQISVFFAFFLPYSRNNGAGQNRKGGICGLIFDPIEPIFALLIYMLVINQNNTKNDVMKKSDVLKKYDVTKIKTDVARAILMLTDILKDIIVS